MKTFPKYLRRLTLLLLLIMSNIIESQTCTVNFTSQNLSQGTVAFTVTSAAGSNSSTVYSWNFGNGSPTFTATGSQGSYPTYQYTATGIYTVTVTVFTAPNCIATASQTVSVTVCNPITANFTFTNGANGVTVNFTNNSIGTNSNTTYMWNFGDGNTSTLYSPSHTYTISGSYLVGLIATDGTNTACSSTYSFMVLALPCPLNGSFSYSVGPNNQLNLVSTTPNLNFPITVHSWTVAGPNFLQTNGLSSTPNYSLVVSGSGIYTVSMYVSNSICSSLVSNTLTITGNAPCNLNASFSYTQGTNGAYVFYNTSTGTNANTSYTWNFGDGNVASGNTTASHTYTSAGIYNMILTAMNASTTCVDSTTQIINVTGIPCVANANFSLTPTNVAQFWTATPAYPWNVTNAIWTWGDGSSSNQLYTSHSYSAAGLYSICLTVTTSCGSNASACSTYSVYKMTSAANIININVVSPVQVAVGLDDMISGHFEFSFFPNPTSGKIILEGVEAYTDVEIYNSLGGLILKTSLEEIKPEIDLRDYTKGIYFIKLSGAKASVTRKVIRE